jgi:uncharacterized UPF0146 family protein
MAEVKNNFLKSKMNKDLDDRLVPEGEYRHAQNITIAKSEGGDVGALENILGNDLISNFVLDTLGGELIREAVEVIGHFMDVKNDRIIVFMTNYVDISIDTLSNFAPTGAYNIIGVYDLKTTVSSIIVSGRFLNFSKTHEIYSIDLIDDLLFWTDNRNQPRKINLSQALADNSYYTTEDHISVSKYYPFQTIDLIENRITEISLSATDGLGYSVSNNVSTTPYQFAPGAVNEGTGLTVNILSVGGSGEITSLEINNPGYGYNTNDVITINGGSTLAQISVITTPTSTMHDVVSDYLPDGVTDNIYRQPYDNTQDITWKGDPEYLKERFVRFSYRFKFDDGEYSLIAPFTQTCFIPENDAYFMGQDDIKSYKSTELSFMKNKINDITLIINSPTLTRGGSWSGLRPGYWNTIRKDLKVVEVDILYKEANQNVIKIVDTITTDQLDLIESAYLRYNYKSIKPWKTLPESDVLRVHDQVPVRALTQEMAGNRIIYGNYIDKPTPPSSINYSCNIVEKPSIISIKSTQIEYQNQNLKQNRTYQVGVVLSDRYGRQSTVILSTLDEDNISSTIKGSTIFHKYKETGFSSIPNHYTGPIFSSVNPVHAWDGDELNLTFWDTISSNKNAATGEPGIYNATTNPMGWYSYKIVIKQVEQDYYNVYFPGILNGFIDGDGSGTAATSDDPIGHFALHGDNINKIPRDLTLVGPNQATFRSGRPSVKEDPSYYKFVKNGKKFSADPNTVEGRELLKNRDRERDLEEGSQITNSSVKLSLRLKNVVGGAGTSGENSTEQAYPGDKVDTVVTIGTGSELGLWDPGAISPFNSANTFYGYKNNPYIAKTILSDFTTGLEGPHPDAGKFTNQLVVTHSGSDYVAGDENIACNINSVSGAGTGFKVNISAVATGGVTFLNEADPGTGWSALGSTQTFTGNFVTGAGNALCQFDLIHTKTKLGNGEMQPSLAVYETEPLQSKLDIYWETSTYGLVNELNENILYNDDKIPVSFGDFNSDPITSTGTEETIIGDFITGNILALNSIGTALNAGPNTFTLLSAIDGYGNTRTNEFEIGDGSLREAFRIKLKEVQVCDWDHSKKENFIFNISVRVPSSSYSLANPTYMDKTLVLGPLPINNIDPSFTAPPNPTIPLTGSINGGLVDTFNAVNGSVVGGGLETEDITFVLTDTSGELYLDYSTNIAGQVQLMSRSSGIAGSYPITLQVLDGGGLSESYVNTVTLS